MDSDASIGHFAQLARAYCLWAEGEPGPAEHEAQTAMKLLAGLLAGVLDLPALFGEEDAPDIDSASFDRVFKRFQSLPFDFYSRIFDSRVVPPEEPTVASLAADLADIWRDLKPGLMQFDAGFVPAAAWWWRDHFNFHWGHHVVGAIYALECWLNMPTVT